MGAVGGAEPVEVEMDAVEASKSPALAGEGLAFRFLSDEPAMSGRCGWLFGGERVLLVVLRLLGARALEDWAGGGRLTM